MRVIDITGKRFGQLTVLSSVGLSPRNEVLWRCICDCGTEKTYASYQIRKLMVVSCGCHRINKFRDYNKNKSANGFLCKHRRAYDSWKKMLDRCYNNGGASFYRYGARGISVCQRWRDSFSSFLSDMGDPPLGLTLERVNNDGDYSFGNCRWATRVDQARNRRSCKLTIESAKEIYALAVSGVRRSEIAERFGVSISTITAIKTGKNWPEISAREKREAA